MRNALTNIAGTVLSIALIGAVLTVAAWSGLIGWATKRQDILGLDPHNRL